MIVQLEQSDYSPATPLQNVLKSKDKTLSSRLNFPVKKKLQIVDAIAYPVLVAPLQY
ncbi:hypothetical protein [Nostoc sp. 'Lobaria pulmonaria (5183) cyanobiont']|uniref:hypothetical protein n=1 Tax=Nostoc sp. 'Lobaria pulmonaria (5183) cyanobiont' TaxID=1618022 RepID=UPI001319D085|nr:hypothetical protein [Nostoc sp. 'Lobaria pulmonaria (5183) cyanobiont']